MRLWKEQRHAFLPVWHTKSCYSLISKTDNWLIITGKISSLFGCHVDILFVTQIIVWRQIPVMFPIYMRSGKLVQIIISREGKQITNWTSSNSFFSYSALKHTLLTVGASIACWTSTLVRIGSSYTLTTIVTWVKSNTQICFQLTVLSTATV